MNKVKIVYASSSEHKKLEARTICEKLQFQNSKNRWSAANVGEFVEFEFRGVRIREILERDLVVMVREKAKAAYAQLQVPCIVEHGGIVFSDVVDQSYPGGLTQPMWDALQAEGFLRETNGAGRRALARAVIGYCDGMRVLEFSGETCGSLTNSPRGNRDFYWDTIFVPDGQQNGGAETYSEMAAKGAVGLFQKVTLSQSTKAMLKFLDHRLTVGPSDLFRNLG